MHTKSLQTIHYVNIRSGYLGRIASHRVRHFKGIKIGREGEANEPAQIDGLIRRKHT